MERLTSWPSRFYLDGRPLTVVYEVFSPALDRPMGAGAGDGEGDGNGAGAASMRTSSTSNLGGGAKRPPDADTELAQA